MKVLVTRSLVTLALVVAGIGLSHGQNGSESDLLQTKRASLPLRNSIAHDVNGVWLIAPKIVGGSFAKPGDDPWQVALIRAAETGPDRRPFCGGSLIADSWILTAAHCVDNGTLAADLNVLGGTTDVDTGGARVAVAQIFVHPDYVAGDVPRNDIALLELKSPLAGPQIQAVSLLQPESETVALAEDATARVTGWGAVGEGGPAVRDLRYIDLTIFTNQECDDPVAYDNAVKDEMVCAGFAKEPRDSCQGDSGGPLTVVVQSRSRLAGIVSWGEGCARPNRYGVYTRVARYVGWVADCEAKKPSCRTPTHANAVDGSLDISSENFWKNRSVSNEESR